MVKRLKSRRLSGYLLLHPDELDREMWQADVELMSIVEEAAQLEASLRDIRDRERRSHAPQWGRETEERLRARLWVILNLLEMEGRYGPAMEFVRRYQRRGLSS